jgi:hypothetical protein
MLLNPNERRVDWVSAVHGGPGVAMAVRSWNLQYHLESRTNAVRIE